MRRETRTIWLDETARHWRWCRVRDLGQAIEPSPVMLTGCQVVAYTVSREVVTTHYQRLADVGYVGHTLPIISRVLYRNVMGDVEGVTDPPPGAVHPRLDITGRTLPPQRQVVGLDVVEAATESHHLFQRYWEARLAIEAGPRPAPAKGRTQDYVIGRESGLIWLLPEYRRHRWVLETVSGTIDVPRMLVVAHSITDCGRFRVWALPLGTDPSGSAPWLPGWQAVRPSSIRTGQPSRPPRKLFWSIRR